MPRNSRLSEATVNAQGDALARLTDGGFLNIYDGAQPADSNDPVTTQNLLVQLQYANPSAPATVGGVVTFNALAAGTAIRSGVASWYRTYAADGVTPVIDGSAGVAEDEPNLVLSDKNIILNAEVVVDANSFTHTVEKAVSGL